MTTNERTQGLGLEGRAAARRLWGVPALAITLLAGTSTGLAQNSAGGGFGLIDAVRDQANAGSATAPAAGNGAPVTKEPVDLAKLEGSVNVNEYDLVDLHVNSEDLGAVLQLLSIQSQRNIISSNSVQASVTADLYGVTFYEALDAILHVNGFGYIEKGNFIYVYTRAELEEFERLSRRAVSRVVNLDYLNASDAMEFVKHLLSETGNITTNGATAAFTISDGAPSGADTFANTATVVIRDFEENVEEITALIAEIDTKPVQVLVEATILQTRLNEANAFGMDFSIISDMNIGDFLGDAVGGPLNVVDSMITGQGQQIGGTAVPAAGTDGDGIGVGSNIGNVGGDATLKVGIVSDDISVFLRVLDEVTDTTVVSNPKLLTLNRQPARVMVGSQIGYLNTTTTDTSTTQSVEFLEVGTTLSVRPFVSKSGLIRLELRPEVSNATLRQVEGNTIPDKDETSMTTNVMLRDGQTAVLGGLFTERTTSSRRQVPLLGDIPLIGQAFRGNDDTTERTEIIFLITPSIVNDEILADAGALGTQAVDNARVGARKSLLPFSRERRVGQLLIEARGLADQGDTSRALFLIERALRLSPQSPDARAMKTELTNRVERMPSRGIMNGILRRELLRGERPLVNAINDGTPTPAPTPDQNPNPAFAEVPVPLSHNGGVQSNGTDYEDGWLTAEVEVVESADPDARTDAGQAEPDFQDWNQAFMTESDTDPAGDNARFDTMKSVATAQPEATLPDDWDRWAQDTGGQPATIDQVAGGLADLGGFLVIPLPGGGALHVEWPVSEWNWANTYTEVPLTPGAGRE